MNNEERDVYILNKVRKHYEYLKSLNYNIVAVFAHGSMNYGLYIQDEDYRSDVDTKAIVLPTLDDLVSGTKMTSKTYDLDGEHIDVKDIRIFVELWKKTNPAYLEILFTKYRVINDKYRIYIKPILEMADDIVEMNYPRLAKCISGMSKEKVFAMEHPYPSLLDKIEKYHYDPKQLHHIIRLNQLIRDVYLRKLSFGDAIRLDRDPNIAKYLIEVKKGSIPLYEARILAEITDKDTKDIKDDVLLRNKDFEFNSKTWGELKRLTNAMVKANIIMQIKDDIT